MSKVNYFLCRICGECCSGRMKVFLNPRDVTLLLSYFALKGDVLLEEDLYEKRILVRDNKNGHDLPRLNFKKALGIMFCPFLENRVEEDGTLSGLCSLHPEFKPLVCHLAPLTREVDFETNEEIYGFVPPHSACPGCDLPQIDRIDENRICYDRLSPGIKERLEEEKLYFQGLWEKTKSRPKG